MKRFGFLVGAVLLLIIGGGLTSQIAANNGVNRLPATLIQFDQPDASVFEATPSQAQAFLLMVGFILFNLIGMAVTVTALFYFLDRAVRRSRATSGSSGTQTAATRVEEASS